MEFSSFEKWLFDRPDTGVEWYFDIGFIAPNLTTDEAVAYTEQVFSRSRLYADRYSERQVCLGFNYLMNPSCSEHCYLLLDTKVAEPRRSRVFSAMYTVFSEVFKSRCADTLARSGVAGRGTYGATCYMWWDVFPRHGVPSQDNLRNTDEAILGTLERILHIDSDACQESAIHGLGHWHSGYPEAVERILDTNTSRITTTLRQFALEARTGNVQ